MSAAESYARWVLEPDNVDENGRLIKLAAQRFLNDLERDDIYFDEEEGSRMLNFGERYCYQWEGDWEGVLIKWQNWQKFIFQQVFGWIRKDTGTRRFDEVFVEVAKKNGKSTMCAVLMVDHVVVQEKVNTPKVFTAANNEDQAKICVNMAGRIIEASPKLSIKQERKKGMKDPELKLFNYKDNITEIVNTKNNGFIKAFSKESSDKKLKTSGGKHGVNASLGIVDEFGMSPDHGASKAIKSSMASRKERLMFYITTAGYNMAGPCYSELRKVGIQVLEGTVQKDNYLPIIFEMDEGDDWKDEKNWKKCNPNLDVSVNRDFLRGIVSDAITYGGTTEVEAKTLNFNLWVNSPTTFISSEVWKTNTHGMSEADLEGCICYGGMELVGAKGLSSFVLIFPGEVVRVKAFFWMPEEYIANNSEKFDGYGEWRDFIKVDAGNTVENDFISPWLIEEISKYNMHSFAYAKGRENDDIIQYLIKAGINGNPLSQSLGGVATPTSQWEDLLTAGKVEHFNNPVMTWMNGNCNVVRKEIGIRLERAGSGIVGISAAINAVAQYKTIESTEMNDQLIESW